MTKQVKDYPTVYVKWDDSAGPADNWTDVEELIKDYEKPAYCHSIGFLIFEDEAKVIVCPHLTDPSGPGSLTGCGEMMIPKSAIVSLVKLDTNKKPGSKKSVTGYPR